MQDGAAPQAIKPEHPPIHVPQTGKSNGFGKKKPIQEGRHELAFAKFSAALSLIESDFEEKNITFHEAIRALACEACNVLSQSFDIRVRFFMLDFGDGAAQRLNFICSDDSLECGDIQWTRSKEKHEIQLSLEWNKIFYFTSLRESDSIGAKRHYKKAKERTVALDRQELGEAIGRDREIATIPLATDREKIGILVIDRDHNPSHPLSSDILQKSAGMPGDPWHKRDGFKEFVIKARTSIHSVLTMHREEQMLGKYQGALQEIARLVEAESSSRGTSQNLREIIAICTEPSLALSKIKYSELFGKAAKIAAIDGLPSGVQVELSETISRLNMVFKGDANLAVDAIAGAISEAGASANSKVAVYPTLAANGETFSAIFHIRADTASADSKLSPATEPGFADLTDVLKGLGAVLHSSHEGGYLAIELPTAIPRS